MDSLSTELGTIRSCQWSSTVNQCINFIVGFLVSYEALDLSPFQHPGSLEIVFFEDVLA